MEDGPGQPSGERPSSAAAFRLGAWIIEPQLNCVSRGDQSVHVRRQLIDLLVFLAGRPGQVVSKEEIFQAVWPGQFVAESGLARCISQLRDVFDEDPRDPKIIQTIPTRGYRLVAEVRPLGEEAEVPPVGAADAPIESTAPAPAPRRWRQTAAVAAVVVVVAAAGFAAWRSLRPPSLGEQDTLLVSFENRTGDAVFDDTLRLALIVQLEQSPTCASYPSSASAKSWGS